MTQITIIAIAVASLLAFIGIFFLLFYKRTSKEIAFVRTGTNGLRVCKDGALFIIPLLHEVIPVKMNTFRLDVTRNRDDAVITKDRMRADIAVDFFIRVKPNEEAIATAAQSLGASTLDPNKVRETIEAKLVSAIRSVASEMTMEELHEQRPQFTQTVLNAVSEDLSKNGLELESVALTALDQSNIQYFREDNLFDAVGMTKLTETVEQRRKERNAIKQDTEVEIKKKNLETEQISLQINRDQEYARIQQEGEVSIRKAEQRTNISMQEALKHQEAEQSRISAELNINMERITAEESIESREIQKKLNIDKAAIDSVKNLQLAEQDKQIAVSQRSEEESKAMQKADEARGNAVLASERVETIRQTEIAERLKTVEVIDATKEAEKGAVGVKVNAEADKVASQNRAESILIIAKAERDSDIARAEGKQRTFAVEAEGINAINNAENILKDEQITAKIRSLIIEKLPEIIAASAKPLENIDSIKIVQMNGVTPGGSNGESAGNNGSLADQAVNAALKYRAQVPLVDGLLQELGIKGSDINGLNGVLTNKLTPVAYSHDTTPTAEKECLENKDAHVVSANEELIETT